VYATTSDARLGGIHDEQVKQPFVRIKEISMIDTLDLSPAIADRPPGRLSWDELVMRDVVHSLRKDVG
jgi:hypothetical protein